VIAARSAVGLVVALGIAFIAGTAATAPAEGAPPGSIVHVWGDGAEWQVRIGDLATVQNRWQPFYVIAPIVTGSPQSFGMWGFGPHDHVMHVPPHVRGTGIGTCKVLLVVQGPTGVPGQTVDVVPDPDFGIPFVRAADLDGDGTMEPLTSAASVEAAAASGLVSLFEPQPGGAPIAFQCPVRPLRG